MAACQTRPRHAPPGRTRAARGARKPHSSDRHLGDGIPFKPERSECCCPTCLGSRRLTRKRAPDGAGEGIKEDSDVRRPVCCTERLDLGQQGRRLPRERESRPIRGDAPVGWSFGCEAFEVIWPHLLVESPVFALDILPCLLLHLGDFRLRAVLGWVTARGERHHPSKHGRHYCAQNGKLHRRLALVDVDVEHGCCTSADDESPDHA